MRRSDRYIEEVEENKYSRVSKNEHLLKELEVGIGRDNEEEEMFSRSEKTEDSDTIGFSDNIDLEGYNLKNYIRKAKENVKENDESLVANQFSYLEELNKKLSGRGLPNNRIESYNFYFNQKIISKS